MDPMASENESLKGRLLIASPTIIDPNFRRSVILMTDHGDEGAMGLILNRVASATVAEAVPELDWVADPGEPVHVGGPVAAGSVIVIAEFDDPARAALLVDDDLGFVPAEIDDREAFATGLRRTRVFAGHAGWGPGQLEAELEEKSWILEPAARDDVFTDDPEELWSQVLRRKGREYVLLSTMPEDPSLN
jgi:putative transcriptional regulator